MSEERAQDDRLRVERLLAGSEAEFEDFFAKYFPPLYRFALARLGRDPDAAEEVVQATLERALARLAGYRGEAALLTWLTTICRHQIADYYGRNRSRLREVELAEDVPEVRAALESLATEQGQTPERALARAELKRLVQAALDHLPARYGEALEWKYIEGLSVKEIADRLGLGPKAAESLLTRAREAFRDAFAAMGGGTPWEPSR